jgi:hypothetical protein
MLGFLLSVSVTVVAKLSNSTFGVLLSTAGGKFHVDQITLGLFVTGNSCMGALKVNGSSDVMEFPDPSPPPKSMVEVV